MSLTSFSLSTNSLRTSFCHYQPYIYFHHFLRLPALDYRHFSLSQPTIYCYHSLFSYHFLIIVIFLITSWVTSSFDLTLCINFLARNIVYIRLYSSYQTLSDFLFLNYFKFGCPLNVRTCFVSVTTVIFLIFTIHKIFCKPKTRPKQKQDWGCVTIFKISFSILTLNYNLLN